MEVINHEYYVSLEVAKLLKESGFAWECRMIHFCHVEDDHMWNLEDNHKQARRILKLDYCLLAPTLEVTQRWLREVKKLYVEVQIFSNSNINSVRYGVNIENSSIATPELYNTYEEAQEAGIQKALEIILEK